MAGITNNITRDAIDRDQDANASRGITQRLQTFDGYVASFLAGLQAIKDELAADAALTGKDENDNDVSASLISADTITEVEGFLAIVRDGGQGASGETHLGLAGVIAEIDAYLAQSA